MFRVDSLSSLARNASVVLVVAALVFSGILLLITLMTKAGHADELPDDLQRSAIRAAIGGASAIHPANPEHVSTDGSRSPVPVQVADNADSVRQTPARHDLLQDGPAIGTNAGTPTQVGLNASSGASTGFRGDFLARNDDEKVPPGPWFIGLEPVGSSEADELPAFRENFLLGDNAQHAYGASLRVGHMVTPRGLLFGDFGYQRTTAETRISLVDVPPFAQHDFDGLRLGLGGQYSIGGLGGQYSIGENLLMQADFTLKLHEDSRFGAVDFETDQSLLRIGVAYTF